MASTVGIYESVLHVGDLDGLPLLLITSLQPLTPTAPSAPYLRAILGGLGETFGWDLDERVGYLLRAPGVSPAWTPERLAGSARREARGECVRPGFDHQCRWS